MNKTELIKELKELVSEVENEKKFTEEHNCKDKDYIAYSHGYILGRLEYIIKKGEL